MNIDPKKLAEEAQEKMAGLGGLGGNLMDQAKDKIGDVVENLKDGKLGGVTDTLKEKASEAIDKGAEMLGGLADKLKH
ncbi:MAG: hypothetical protein HDS23_02290 [Bacteroides sp.]|nr:hypothetical protein [Bacteroides sp.]MBD5339618.1 hypothetical protein [Bacteroides sp.]